MWQACGQMLCKVRRVAHGASPIFPLTNFTVPSYALFSPSFSDGVCSFPVSFPAYPQEFPISSSVTPANEPPLHRGENAPPPISLEAAPLQFTFGPIYKDVFNNSPVLNQAPFLPWSPHGFSYSRATGQQVHLDIPDDITSPTPQIALYSSPTQSMSPPKTGSTRNPCPSPPTLKSESSFGSSFELSERSPRAPDTPSDGIITPILIDNDATMSLSFHEVESVGRLHSASSNVPAVPLSTSPGGGLADSWDFVGKLEDDPSPKLAPLTDQSLDNSYVDIGEEKPHYSMLPQLDNGRTAIGKALQPSRGPPQPSETPKKRPIGEEARKRIFYTRKIGACLRCHMQRTKVRPRHYVLLLCAAKIVQCEPSSEDTDADCMTCLKFDKTSKKTIHNLPCLRYKLTTITMYRTGGLGLTKRFPDNEVKNVDIIGTPFVIEIIHGFRGKPMRLEVGRFEPREGDVVTRQYGDGKEAHYAPFCLHSVEKTSEDFLQYLHDNAFAALGEAAQSEPGIIGQTLRVLMAHYFTLPVSSRCRLRQIHAVTDIVMSRITQMLMIARAPNGERMSTIRNSFSQMQYACGLPSVSLTFALSFILLIQACRHWDWLCFGCYQRGVAGHGAARRRCTFPKRKHRTPHDRCAVRRHSQRTGFSKTHAKSLEAV